MTLLGYKKCKPINNHIIRLVGVFEIPEDAIICPNPIILILFGLFCL